MLLDIVQFFFLKCITGFSLALCPLVNNKLVVLICKGFQIYYPTPGGSLKVLGHYEMSPRVQLIEDLNT